MARTRKPFKQNRGTPAPYRRGRQATFYVPDDLRRALADVARAHNNISESQLVCDILQAHPDIAAQLALYQMLDNTGSTPGPDGDGPGPMLEAPDGETWGNVGGLGLVIESPDRTPRKKRAKHRHQEQDTDQGETAQSDQEQTFLVVVG